MTIYLGITPDKLAEAAVIVNLFFDQLLNQNTRTLPKQDKSLQYQCLMILDEFTAIGKVNMIAKSISYQAGYNMRVLTIIQNKSQLEDVYGKSGAVTLMSNHALMIMYAPSPVVQSDAKEYSEMLGDTTVKSKSKSHSYSKQSSHSDSISDQKRALMLPQEIKEIGRWRRLSPSRTASRFSATRSNTLRTRTSLTRSTGSSTLTTRSRLLTSTNSFSGSVSSSPRQPIRTSLRMSQGSKMLRKLMTPSWRRAPKKGKINFLMMTAT